VGVIRRHGDDHAEGGAGPGPRIEYYYILGLYVKREA